MDEQFLRGHAPARESIGCGKEFNEIGRQGVGHEFDGGSSGGGRQGHDWIREVGQSDKGGWENEGLERCFPAGANSRHGRQWSSRGVYGRRRGAAEKLQVPGQELQGKENPPQGGTIPLPWRVVDRESAGLNGQSHGVLYVALEPGVAGGNAGVNSMGTRTITFPALVPAGTDLK
jgi:hypothetical protein